MRIAVLGAGRVGAAMVRDLAAGGEFEVTAVDRDPDALGRLATVEGVIAIRADLRDAAKIRDLADGADLVISAVPGAMGFATLQAILDAGLNVVDISFFPEDPFLLDEAARTKGVTAVVDCGVAPGLSNVIAGWMYDRLEKMESYLCYVGGLPSVRRWPFEYQAVFSPADVIEEYVRPARYVEHGREVVRPALSGRELLDFPGVGTLEAFNTDGLRTLARTLDVPNMKEMTLRYPGHAELMRVFRETGLFDPAEIDVDGVRVSPLAVTSRLLFDKWQSPEGTEEFTVMQVVVEGTEEGRDVRHTFDLLDCYDAGTNTTSMARTTGYTATIVARQIARGLFTRKGISAPEHVGRTAGCYGNLLEEYGERGIRVRHHARSLGV